MLMEMEKKIELSEQQKLDFEEQGYLVFPSFLDEDMIQKLKESVDLKHNTQAAKAGNGKHVIEYGELGRFTSHPDTMSILDQLFGDKNYTMHHIHAVRQDANNGGVHWHHDYEQHPQTNRNYLMVHTFFYLNGLNGEVGDLLALPGSHKTISQRDLSIFGTDDLPGSLTFDDLSPGSMVLVHSGLFHGRRKKPGGENLSRYFIDISYCEKGIKWPGYGQVGDVNKIALENDLDRDGEYAYLYDTEQFYKRGAIVEKLSEVDDSIKHLFEGRN